MKTLREDFASAVTKVKTGKAEVRGVDPELKITGRVKGWVGVVEVDSRYDLVQGYPVATLEWDYTSDLGRVTFKSPATHEGLDRYLENEYHVKGNFDSGNPIFIYENDETVRGPVFRGYLHALGYTQDQAVGYRNLCERVLNAHLNTKEDFKKFFKSQAFRLDIFKRIKTS